MNRPLVLAITGASGAIYAIRLLELLLRSGREVHLAISPSGQTVLRQELAIEIDAARFDPAALGRSQLAAGSEFAALVSRLTGLLAEALADANSQQRLHCHAHNDFMSPIASGSFVTGGMVVCPCSGGTLSGIVHGSSGNLIQRAAEVHLKERRKLILVPRETPLSLIQLKNMQAASEAGAVVLPASPGWYHGVRSMQDLVDFVVARILDHLELTQELMRRWGT